MEPLKDFMPSLKPLGFLVEFLEEFAPSMEDGSVQQRKKKKKSRRKDTMAGQTNKERSLLAISLLIARIT